MHVQKSVSLLSKSSSKSHESGTVVPTRLGWAYPLYAVGVLGGLFLFLGLYLGVLAGAAYLLFLLLNYEGGLSGGLLFWALFGVASLGSGVVFLFLLKGLFKRQRANRSGYVEIVESDEPRLFGFLRDLCEETGAAMPHRVYLCADVNAGVFFDSSVLSIFWPVKKNLLIGLGLVNSLNYSEFKAVLAHEFGHFSQRTMRLSNYVYLVHSVLHNMVHGRDKSDELLTRWREKYLGFLGLAWVLSAAVWAVRRTMGGFLKVITILDAALSREMEFHADRVAVEATGSMAIVHALYKTEYAHQCMMQTFYDLRQAAARELFTRDVFYHHSRTIDFMRVAKKDPTMGIPPAEETGAWVFDHTKAAVTSVWDSHPSYAEREAHARRNYVEGEIDSRSPWFLFLDPAAVRARITLALELHDGLEADALLEPRVVQTFIDDEHAEIIFDQKYLGMYDHRFIEPGDLDVLVEQAVCEEELDAGTLHARWNELYGEGLATFMNAFQERMEEMQMLETVIGDQLVWGKTFVFRGEQHRPSEAPELFSKVYNEMERDRRWFGELDQAVFLHHYQIAHCLDAKVRDEFLYRYRFHLTVQEMTRRLRVVQTRLGKVLRMLNCGELDEEQIDFVFDELLRIHADTEQEIGLASEWQVPLLNNIEQGSALSDVVMPGALVSAGVLHAQELNSDWMRVFLGQFEELLNRLSHMRRKSLGSLLFFQEDILRQFEERI